MSSTYSIAAIPGDGIGLEVLPVAVSLIDVVARRHGFSIQWTDYPWGSEYYRQHGRMMPEDGIEQLRRHEAIFFGAVGSPGIPDDVTLWGLLIPIRREFQQYINLRPAKYIPGVRSPLASPDGIDLVIVRENVEGEYSEIGGRFGRGTDAEMAVQEAIFTRTGIARVAAYARDLALSRSGNLVSATKSNGIIHTMPFWDEVVTETVRGSGVTLQHMLVDALAAALVSNPRRFDVIVASNLFGDILSDLAAAAVGSIGLAASANINPEREHPSMFEPVHGSAPDIAGQGLANPIAQVLTGVLMLEHLGENEASRDLHTAAHHVLAHGPHTRDLGGEATTADVHAALLAHLS
jgi:tartrate dehydrogenase/decarboxylase/D-malate dehydrogenase